MLVYDLVDRFLVIDSVPHETVYFSVNLVQKIRHLGRIRFVPLGDLGCQYATGVIHANVHFLPALTPLLSMFTGVPFSLTAYLQSRAIYNKGPEGRQVSSQYA